MTRKLHIVDDNLQFAELLARVAALDGWSVSVSRDGAALIEELGREDGAALVILDILMPEQDGIELLPKLAEIGRPLRLIFATGGAAVNARTAGEIAAGLRLDVGPPIFKPIPVARFRKILAEEQARLSAPGA